MVAFLQKLALGVAHTITMTGSMTGTENPAAAEAHMWHDLTTDPGQCIRMFHGLKCDKLFINSEAWNMIILWVSKIENSCASPLDYFQDERFIKSDLSR